MHVKFNRPLVTRASIILGQRPGSRDLSIPDADQKDRSSGNENDSTEDRSMLKRNTINQTIDICDPPQEFDAKGESTRTTRLHNTLSVP